MDVSLPAAKQRLRRGRMMLVSALASSDGRREASLAQPMRCWQARRHVSSYLDGELDEATKSMVEGHLAGCPTCPPLYTSLVGIRATMGELRDADAVVEDRDRPTYSRTPRPGVRAFYSLMARGGVELTTVAAGEWNGVAASSDEERGVGFGHQLKGVAAPTGSSMPSIRSSRLRPNMSIVIWHGMNLTPTAWAISSRSLGLATLYFLASLNIIQGPMPMKFILLSLRWLMPGRCMKDIIFCIQFLPVMRLLVLHEGLEPQNVTKTIVSISIAPAVEARISVAQVFSSSPL